MFIKKKNIFLFNREPDKENNKVTSERISPPPPLVQPQQQPIVLNNRDNKDNNNFTHHRTAVLNELSNVINERRNKATTLRDVPDSSSSSGTRIKSSSTLNNFKITTYESARPVLAKQFSESDALSQTTVSVVRRSSFTGDEKRGSLPTFVKR
jgi:hypothetical protein